MSARYAGATIRLLDGSDHALSDFDEHLPFCCDFCVSKTEDLPFAGPGGDGASMVH